MFIPDETTFIEPPFNYTGSKFSLLPQLIPLFDKTKTRFVDLFAGGGSVYSNIIGTHYKKALVNDIIKDLVECHRALITDCEATIAKTKALAVARDDAEGYGKLRESYNEEPDCYKLWALICCCTNNMMRFNKKFKFNQTFGKRTLNENIEQKAKLFGARLNPHYGSLEIISKHFKEIKCNPDDMVYLDPPYSGNLSNNKAG